MHIVIPDDYQDAVRHLDCFAVLAGHEVTVYNDSVTEIDSLVERFQDADALVLIRERTAITESLLAKLPRLKVISQTGRGIPHVDVAACTRHKIPVLVGGGSPFSTAELTWALVLAATRHIPQEVANLKAGRWQRKFGIGLHGRTLGIFSYGNIGKLVANYGRAFGMNVLIWGREGSQERARADGYDTVTNQRELFERSDVLSLHVDMRPGNENLIGMSELALLKGQAIVINSCRGEVLDAHALAAELRSGRLAGCVIDVYAPEPPPVDYPLLGLSNALLTPHMAARTHTAILNMSWVVKDVLGVLSGEPAMYPAP